MDSSAACGMPTADESNHSAAGALHPHHSTTSMHAISHNYATTPIGYNGVPIKLPLSVRRSPLPSNTPFPQPTPLTTTNGRFSTIHSADKPTDRPTDGLSDNSVPTHAYALDEERRG